MCYKLESLYCCHHNYDLHVAVLYMTLTSADFLLHMSGHMLSISTNQANNHQLQNHMCSQTTANKCWKYHTPTHQNNILTTHPHILKQHTHQVFTNHMYSKLVSNYLITSSKKIVWQNCKLR